MKLENKINCKTGNYGTIVMKVVRKDGTVKSVTSQNMHSYVENYWRMIQVLVSESNQTLTRMNGSTSLFTVSGGRLVSANSGILNGIVVGTDNTPFSLSDTQLGSIVPHGTGTGQLTYGVSSAVHEGDNLFVECGRTFENLSGSPINIREVGISTWANPSTSNGYLIIRDVLDSDIIVGVDEILHVYFKFGFTDGGRNWRALYNRHVNTDLIGAYMYRTSGGQSALSNLTSHIRATSNINAYSGLLIGSGTTPVTFSDITLDSIIEHGTGDNLVHASITTFPDMVVNINEGWLYFDVIRNFTNLGSVNITVNEFGHHSSSPSQSSYPATNSHLNHRIVLPEPVIISPNSTKTVVYRFRYDVGV